jgi:hypothetical protein
MREILAKACELIDGRKYDHHGRASPPRSNSPARTTVPHRYPGFTPVVGRSSIDRNVKLALQSLRDLDQDTRYRR